MRFFALLFFLTITIELVNSQIVINEASNRNYTQITAEDGNQYDWIELYNKSNDTINLNGWGLSDSKTKVSKWTFPSYQFKPKSYLLVYASNLDIKEVIIIDHWELAVQPGDTFSYIEPTKAINDWNTLGFDDSFWGKGKAGFGFGNGDDSTLTSTKSLVVYIRKKFIIPDTSAISSALLYMDYDDGFVAYLNGVEIARAAVDGTPSWNSLASIDHTAQMWQGGSPDRFKLDMAFIRSLWKQGENVFAAEVHNKVATSSDLSLIPYLGFAISNQNKYFRPVPEGYVGPSGISLHTNFKIQWNGETLFLTNPDSAKIDSLKIPRVPLNCSVGRITDGADETGVFLVSTPGQTNNTSKGFTNGQEPTPQFSQPAGFYNTTVSVSISDSSGSAIIRYTLDGSEPTEKSTLYSGAPISISTTKTLKSKCFSKTDKIASKTKTATYFIKKTHVLPVISVSTENANLYGTTGIFDNTNFDWNKPCYVEYFDDKQQLQFFQEAGMQIDGGAGGSRTHPQHSFRIEPGNSALGEGDVKYELIPDRPNRKSYSSFYLRNGSNQYNTLQYKDGFQVKAIAKNTATYYSAYTPVVVYINGSYFGLYELREKLNADYLKENYQMDIDSLDLLTLSYYKGLVLEALEGSVDPFWEDVKKFNSLNPSDKNYLEEVSKFLHGPFHILYRVAPSISC